MLYLLMIIISSLLFPAFWVWPIDNGDDMQTVEHLQQKVEMLQDRLASIQGNRTSFNDPICNCRTDFDADSQFWASFFKDWVTFLVLFPVWLAGVLGFGNSLSGGDTQKRVHLTAASLFGMVVMIGLKLSLNTKHPGTSSSFKQHGKYILL